MWQSNHHVWILRHFSQVLDSLGEFGTPTIPTLSQYRNGGIDSLTPVSWHTIGIGRPTCSLWALKRAIGWDVCEHTKYRGFNSPFSSSETFGFQLCLPLILHKVAWVANCVVPRVLLHSFISAVTSDSKLLSVRGKPLNFLSKMICPSYLKTNSIALQGYINWVSYRISLRTEALLTHIHCAMCLLKEISKRN